MVEPYICGRKQMKTTLNLNDQLLRQAKDFARKQEITLTRFVEEALRARLMLGDSPATKYKFDPPVVGGIKPPAVDVSDRDALYDFMGKE